MNYISKSYNIFKMNSSNGIIDLNKFERQTKIEEGDPFVYYQIVNKMTGATYIARMLNNTKLIISREKLINISREINILTKLNHPSILRFYGYSPNNFKNKPKPLIVLEKPFYNLYDVNYDKKWVGHYYFFPKKVFISRSILKFII